MKILLTGAFGNIGFSSLQQLLEQGHTMRCLDLNSKKAQKKAKLVANKNVELCWGDIRDAQFVYNAVEGQEVIIHFAAMLPPYVDEKPELAQAINVDGTRHLITAAQAQEQQPKFLFSSSLDVFGHTQDKEPPRRVDEPVYATDDYTRHKLEGEEMLKASGLEWAIFRFADVPPLEPREMHAIMYSIPLSTRIEMLHTHDAGLAVANGVKSEIWGRVWLIGGGEKCQVRYQDYLSTTLHGMGLDVPPAKAFAPDSKPYCTDWLDTTESQALLHYQRHDFKEIMHDVLAATKPTGLAGLLLPLAKPMVQKQMLNLSPYITA